jgi:hypothetical protein
MYFWTRKIVFLFGHFVSGAGTFPSYPAAIREHGFAAWIDPLHEYPAACSVDK